MSGHPSMRVRVDSLEYKCWHEVGHATVCLHQGDDVEFIEFLEGDARGHARTRCVFTSLENHRTLACGGFAAEFYLVNSGLAERGPDDKRDISRIIFHNATHDQEAFWRRKLGVNEEFSVEEKTEFMHHAVGPDGWGGVVPIFKQYFSGMQELVRELLNARRVEGKRIRELLRVGNTR
jgi:hypothetical protein